MAAASTDVSECTAVPMLSQFCSNTIIQNLYIIAEEKRIQTDDPVTQFLLKNCDNNCDEGVVQCIRTGLPTAIYKDLFKTHRLLCRPLSNNFLKLFVFTNELPLPIVDLRFMYPNVDSKAYDHSWLGLLCNKPKTLCLGLNTRVDVKVIVFINHIAASGLQALYVNEPTKKWNHFQNSSLYNSVKKELQFDQVSSKEAFIYGKDYIFCCPNLELLHFTLPSTESASPESTFILVKALITPCIHTLKVKFLIFYNAVFFSLNLIICYLYCLE